MDNRVAPGYVVPEPMECINCPQRSTIERKDGLRLRYLVMLAPSFHHLAQSCGKAHLELEFCRPIGTLRDHGHREKHVILDGKIVQWLSRALCQLERRRLGRGSP